MVEPSESKQFNLIRERRLKESYRIDSFWDDTLLGEKEKVSFVFTAGKMPTAVKSQFSQKRDNAFTWYKKATLWMPVP